MNTSYLVRVLKRTKFLNGLSQAFNVVNGEIASQLSD